MTIVVSDTSPLNYLVLIGEVDVLPKLFDLVLIPPAVYAELQDVRTPAQVFAWAATPPSWVKIQQPLELALEAALGPGEEEALALANELKVPVVLVDERKGRLAAKRRGLLPIGTLAILDEGDRLGFVDFERAVLKLQRTNFRSDAKVITQLLAKARSRKNA